MKLCTHTNSALHIPVIRQMDILKQNDFHSVMIFWYTDRFGNNPNQLAEHARKISLGIENIHIPFFGVEHLWKESVDTEDTMKMIMNSLDGCHNHGIGKAVIHPSNWRTIESLNKGGLDRFKKIADRARKYGVSLALENISDEFVLDHLFTEIPDLKFCYDNGHKHIFHKDKNLFMKYSDRLIGMHLTDNLGVDDTHDLPFDGSYDWKGLMNDIKAVEYQGPLSFEVSWQCDDEIKKYSDEAYIVELKKRAMKILEL